MLRGVEIRGITLDRELDAICIGVPRTTPYLPRERPNPLLGAYLGLGLALRLWRDAFPVAEGGTAILFNRFQRHFAHPTQQPYRAFFAATRATGPDNAALAEAELLAAADPRALEEYRAGRSVHPLLPFADWDGCRPALGRLGHVIIAGARDHGAARQLASFFFFFFSCHPLLPFVTGTDAARNWTARSMIIAGCRDHGAARQLGFVPTHGVGPALTMARGWTERPPRVGILLRRPTSRYESAPAEGLRQSVSPRYAFRTCSLRRSAFASSARATLPVSST